LRGTGDAKDFDHEGMEIDKSDGEPEHVDLSIPKSPERRSNLTLGSASQ
jgi:hypothetical protein